MPLNLVTLVLRRRFFDNLTLKLFYLELILKSEVAQMTDTLSTLINSGIPMVEALENCIKLPITK